MTLDESYTIDFLTPFRPLSSESYSPVLWRICKNGRVGNLQIKTHGFKAGNADKAHVSELVIVYKTAQSVFSDSSIQ